MKTHLATERNCTGCGACFASCKHNAISIKYNKKGFLEPVINRDKCINCKACTNNCPILKPEKLTFHLAKEIQNFTAWSLNDELCKKATSGGVFSQLAINFLKEKDSIVCGAFLTNKNTCHHILITSINDIDKIIGTKYIQSDASIIFTAIKQELKKGKRVLFSGTPCQVAGLYCYLGKIDISNLYTAELICHGVPSKVITDISTKYYNAQYILSYRNKKKGWYLNGEKVSSHSTYMKGNGETISPQKGDDLFYMSFGLTHRLSCYKCQYAKPHRIADITLGDQWGMASHLPERNYLGASLVICNSSKGLDWINKAENLYLVKNPNSTLNAPTLFMPFKIEKASLSWYLHYINKLPTNIAVKFIKCQWKKNWLLLPHRLILKFYYIKYLKELSICIKKYKNEFNWL